MVAAASPDSIAELTGAAKEETAQQDARILKQVAALFLSNVDRLRESQMSAFDAVLVPLIERMEASTLVHLSEALSTTDLAPCETIRKLAFHDDPLIAAPILLNSNRLSQKDLVEIVKTHSQQHLLAISGRKALNEALTDALIRLGDVNVSNSLARNAGAQFSECGYATLVGRAERDESLTEKLGLRLDIPANLLRELLAKATDIVRARFLTAPRPAVQARGKIDKQTSAAPRKKIDYAQAQSEVLALNRAGKLNDSTVRTFLLSVANAGNPIPQEDRERLFQPFYRGAVRSSRQGLGLGLYIACQIALGHGGDLAVESDEHETTFSFSMPLTQ